MPWMQLLTEVLLWPVTLMLKEAQGLLRVSLAAVILVATVILSFCSKGESHHYIPPI